jgi:hypothetical protein
MTAPQVPKIARYRWRSCYSNRFFFLHVFNLLLLYFHLIRLVLRLIFIITTWLCSCTTACRYFYSFMGCVRCLSSISMSETNTVDGIPCSEKSFPPDNMPPKKSGNDGIRKIQHPQSNLSPSNLKSLSRTAPRKRLYLLK